MSMCLLPVPFLFLVELVIMERKWGHLWDEERLFFGGSVRLGTPSG